MSRTNGSAAAVRSKLQPSLDKATIATVNDNLINHVARRVLHDLLAFSIEFGTNDTVVGPEQFGMTAADFSIVKDRLTALELVVPQDEEGCCITPRGLETAANEDELNRLFPVEGDPMAPLPTELRFRRRPFVPAQEPPPPMKWVDYERHLRRVWTHLLNSDQQNNEKVFQQFLEKHPVLLPECFGCFSPWCIP